MTRRFVTVGLTVAVPLALLVLSGCFKYKQSTLVMPDGSGKITFRFGTNEKQIKANLSAAGFPTENRPAASPPQMDPEKLQQMFKGFVAFTEPQTDTTDDGWRFVSVTGYFEDINRVSVPSFSRGEAEVMTFTFRKEAGGGFYLACNNCPGSPGGPTGPGAGATANGGLADKLRPMMAQMFKGFEMAWEFEVPGPVRKAEGLSTVDGRKASLSITDTDIFSATEDIEAMKALQAPRNFKIWAGPREVSGTQLTAFKGEMAQAVAEWEKILPKAEAATGAKKEGPDTSPPLVPATPSPAPPPRPSTPPAASPRPPREVAKRQPPAARTVARRDGVALHAQMAPTSKVVKTLRQGDAVTVEFRLAGPQGAWCQITVAGSTGYVRCDDLKRAAAPAWREARTPSRPQARGGPQNVGPDRRALRINVFDRQTAHRNRKACRSLKLPVREGQAIQNISMTLEAYNDDPSYLRAVWFQIDDTGGYLGVDKVAEGQYGGNGTIGQRQRKKWELSLDDLPIAVKGEALSRINFAQLLNRPGDHTICSWISTYEKFGPNSWITLDLKIEVF